MNRIKVGVLGATGMVGQNYIRLLNNHPWFEVTYVAASPRSAGKRFTEAVQGRWLMPNPMPEAVKDLVVGDANLVDAAKSQCEMVFSAIEEDKDVVRRLEEAYAAADFPVVSNNSAHRSTPDVPMMVPDAVKFTEGGAVNVRAETKPGGKIHLRVEDTGVGIPLDAQEKLFELFSQGDETTSRRFGGTGLGLAISKRIVEAMGGEIGFESTPGRGSTFWITVELQRTTTPAARNDAPARRPERSLRILTAEDNPINQVVITEHLKRFGHEVTAVNNGMEVLEAIQAGMYDLVLMDCQMPYLDGYEATRLIRQLPDPVGRTPIIALTAHALREELEKCLAAGMNDVITKPFRGDVLQSTIAHWLGADPEAGPPVHGGSDPNPAEEQTFDDRQLGTLCAMARDSASGPSFLPRLLEKLRATPYMDDLRGALAREDRAALKARAHALKGTSLFLGAVRLQRLCARLELTCTDATLEESRHQVDLIEAELANVVRTLEAAIGSAPAVER